MQCQMAIHQAILHKKHNTHPLFTIFAPLTVNLPIMIIFSLTIRHALEIPGNTMALESFGWVGSLGKGDFGLGAIGGGLAMINAEISEMNRRGREEGAGEGEEEGRGEGSPNSGHAAKTAQSRTLKTPISRSPSAKTSNLARARTSSLSTSQRSFAATTPHLAGPPSPRRPPAVASGSTTRTRPFPAIKPSELVNVDPNAPSSAVQISFMSRLMTNALRAGGLIFFSLGPWVPSVSRQRGDALWVWADEGCGTGRRAVLGDFVDV